MRQKINAISFYVLLPIFLLILGIFSLYNYLKASDFGFLNLDIRGEFSELVSTTSGELKVGDKVTGKFLSKYANLGIISVRFYNQDRDSKDTLMFRLRESNQEDWFYQAKYETDQFLPHKLFPFGFPIIADSADKNYVFELESLRGATGSGILVDYQKPVFVAKSGFTKEELLSNKKQLIYFLSNKFFNIFGDRDTRTNTFFYFLPLIFYFLYLLTSGISYQILTILMALFVYWDIFYLEYSFDFIFIAILFLWWLISKRFRFESRIVASFALLFLCLTPIYLILKEDAIAEKFAIWAYLFLCATVTQQIYELKHKNYNTLSLKSFFRNFYKIKIAPSAFIRKTAIFFVPLTILIMFIYTYLAVNKIIFTNGIISLKSLGISILIFTSLYLISRRTKHYWQKFLFLMQSGYALLILIASTICINSITQKTINIYIQYKEYFPQNYPLMFIKGTIFAFTISILILYVIYLLSRRFKDGRLRIVIFTLSVYVVFGYFLGKTTDFVGNIKILSLSTVESSEAWVDVVIYGKNFKDIPFAGKVYIDGIEQRVVFWSDTQVTFRTNPQTTKSGKVYLVSFDNNKSNYKNFNYYFK